MGSEDREKFEFELNAPLPGEEKKAPSQDDLEADGAAFMALYQQQKKG